MSKQTRVLYMLYRTMVEGKEESIDLVGSTGHLHLHTLSILVAYYNNWLKLNLN